MGTKPKAVPPTVLSPRLAEVWGFVPIHYLILASDDYIVFLDAALEVDWKTTHEWDISNEHHKPQFLEILNRAAEIESAEWNNADQETTLKFKRQIGEAIARALDGDFTSAGRMLDTAEAYRQETLKKRKEAIIEQTQIRDAWKEYFRRWTAVHYAIGISALVLSSLVAAKPIWLGLSEHQISFCAWLVAVLTGTLTFLVPDKKADRYTRAWSILNTEITRYNTNNAVTVDDVLEAYAHGERIIHDAPENSGRRARQKQQ